MSVLPAGLRICEFFCGKAGNEIVIVVRFTVHVKKQQKDMAANKFCFEDISSRRCFHQGAKCQFFLLIDILL